MYVCICQGVTQRQISSSISSGATTLQALRQELGVATCCGKCVHEVRQQLHHETCTNKARCQFCPVAA